jgi:hypothetical protein
MSDNYKRRMKPEEQAQRIVDLWQQRPKPQRTSEGVLTFYGWLSEHESALVPGEPGSYRKLRTVLRDYFEGPP